MDDEIKPPETQEPEASKGMHGGVAFVLMFPVGILAGVGLLIAAGTSLPRGSNLAGLATILSVGLAFAAAFMYRWGLAGFVLGMSVPLCLTALVISICGGAGRI